MKFVCRNSACPACGVPSEDYVVNTYRVGRGGHLVSNNAPCPRCGIVREEINPDPTAALRSTGTVNYSRFTGASPEEKQRILRHRSHEHYEREIREIREDRLAAVRSAIGDDI